MSEWNILVFTVLSNVSDFLAICCRHNFTTNRKWNCFTIVFQFAQLLQSRVSKCRTNIPTTHLFQFPQTALDMIYCCLLSQSWLTERRHVLFWNVSGCTHSVNLLIRAITLQGRQVPTSRWNSERERGVLEVIVVAFLSKKHNKCKQNRIWGLGMSLSTNLAFLTLFKRGGGVKHM